MNSSDGFAAASAEQLPALTSRDLAYWHPWAGVVRGAQQNPDAVALEIGSSTWTYGQVVALSARIANVLSPLIGSTQPPERVAVFASRSLTAYCGSLGVLASGAAHVALNPAYPPSRNAHILKRGGIRTLVVGPEAMGMLGELLEMMGDSMRIIAPLSSLPDALPHAAQTWDMRDIESASAQWAAPAVGWDDLAYLVFTSGSTGEPKGVAITQGNLATYMRNFRLLAAPVASDRVVTTYELTFDVALHDMLNAWWSGATLVVMPDRAMMAPARFILDKRITYWFSVASFAMILQKQGLLKPGAFPLLRVSLLCGEALPLASATAWSAAAPNSVLFNVYGPTETTMELAFYRWVPGESEHHCKRGVAPIGIPFADHDHLLLNEHGEEVVGAGEGELYVSGPQVGPGYWHDDERNAQTFVHLPGRHGIWYKTGDRIERDVLGQYHFISRVDFMVKVRGNRIELGDIESALRAAAGVDWVAVIPLPSIDGMAQGLVAFVCASDGLAAGDIRDRVAQRLPKAWVPDEVRLIDQMPMNANRKVDRAALAAMLRKHDDHEP